MSALWGKRPLARVRRWRRRGRRVHQGFDASVATAPNAQGLECVVVSYLVEGRAHSFGFAETEAREHAQNILGAVSYCRQTNELRRLKAPPVQVRGPNRAQRRKLGRP